MAVAGTPLRCRISSQSRLVISAVISPMRASTTSACSDRCLAGAERFGPRRASEGADQSLPLVVLHGRDAHDAVAAPVEPGGRAVPAGAGVTDAVEQGVDAAQHRARWRCAASWAETSRWTGRPRARRTRSRPWQAARAATWPAASRAWRSGQLHRRPGARILHRRQQSGGRGHGQLGADRGPGRGRVRP